MSNILFTKLVADEKQLVAEKFNASVEDIDALLRNPNSLPSQKRNTELFNAILEKTALEFVAMLRSFEIFSAQRLEELSLLAQQMDTPIGKMTTPKESVRQPVASNDAAIRAAERRVDDTKRAYAKAEAAHYRNFEGLRNECANQAANVLVNLDPAAQPDPAPQRQQIADQMHVGFNQLRPDMARVAVQMHVNPNDREPLAQLRADALQVFGGLLTDNHLVRKDVLSKPEAQNAIGGMFDRFMKAYSADPSALVQAVTDYMKAQKALDQARAGTTPKPQFSASTKKPSDVDHNPPGGPPISGNAATPTPFSITPTKR